MRHRSIWTAVHELSIAAALVDTCVAHAGDSRVLSVRAEIGQLVAVLPDSLRFCFDVCARGTVVEGAKLEILLIPGSAVCNKCGDTTFLVSPFGRCACSGRLRIVTGEELRVKDMEVA
jgi:hydrogenase nickel incorporation protein HypA/HybF